MAQASSASPTIPESPASPIPESPASPTIPDSPASPTIPESPTIPTVPASPTIPAVPASPSIPAVPASPTLPGQALINEAKKSSDGFLGMDNYTNAMLFAEDLIEYVLNKLGYAWPCSIGARKLPNGLVKKRFTTIVGDVVIELMAFIIEYVKLSYTRLMDEGIVDMEKYRRELCITSTMYFKEGYTHKKFLIFAAMVTGISAFFMAKGDSKIADGSAQMLAYVLNYFIYMLKFKPNADWFDMCLTAQQMRRELLSNTFDLE